MIIELKFVESVNKAHKKPVLTYLRLAGQASPPDIMMTSGDARIFAEF